MGIQEYYEGLGVVHSDHCNICGPMSHVEGRMHRFSRLAVFGGVSIAVGSLIGFICAGYFITNYLIK